MAAILLSAVLACLVALFLGQAVLRLAGAREWSWLAPAVGLSAAMLVATPAVQLPGRGATAAALIGLLALVAAVWCLRSPQHRPPPGDLLAALPVVVLVLVPFLAAGRGGVLGVTVNNDMAVHLAIVESILSPTADALYAVPPDYPLGLHSLTAVLTEAIGTEADLAFTGVSLAVPAIGAWTVLAAARSAPWLGKAIAATVVGLPFLVAAYYGQGAFKEVAQAELVLAVALCLSGCGPRLGRGRWAPLAFLIGGIISVFSLPGLPWVAAILGLWLAGLLAIQAWRRQLAAVPGIVREELPALGIGLAVLVATLLPQAGRMWDFLALREGTGIADNDIGNLVGRLPGWEALGIWGSPDFRLPASGAYIGGEWSWFMIVLLAFGAFWAFRRGRWLLPLAAVGAMLIWKLSDGSQSPYIAAKALVVASPLLLLVAALPLIDRGPGRPPLWQWLLVPALGLVLLWRVGSDDARALRFSPVGPTDHARQLISFRPTIAGKRTLFLGADEFVKWWMSGVAASPVGYGAIPELPVRPEKHWAYEQAVDFDTVPASTLNEFEWIVGPRDAASSDPPQQLRLVRGTEAFQLWKRVGPIPERMILEEGEWPGAVFRCDTESGRAILAKGGVAAIRPAPIVGAGGGVAAGGAFSIRMRLPAGTWDLQAPYMSSQPVEVSAPGLSVVLPANLDRIGPRLPIGRIAIRRPRTFTIDFHVRDTRLAPVSAVATFKHVVATPAGRDVRVVPIARACGKYVDWYRSAPS